MQRRIGVVMCLLSLPLFVFGFFVDEPFLVYQMSAGALLFGGLSTVVAAVPSQDQPGKRKPRHVRRPGTFVASAKDEGHGGQASTADDSALNWLRSRRRSAFRDTGT